MSASSGGSSTPVTAPLTFGRYSKPAVAAVQFSPSSPLDDLEAITLTGTGFTPGVGVGVQECALGTTNAPTCDYTTSRIVTAGFHGDFTLTYAVRRDIAASVSPGGATSVDCAINPCELTVQGSQSQPTISHALTFDPNVPAVTPTIAAAPNTGLTDNQQVTVSLDGFTPSQPVQIVECSADAISEGNNFGYCDYNTSQTVTPTGPTSIQTSFVVRAVLNGQSGLVDCTTQPGACVLVATENGSYYGGGRNRRDRTRIHAAQPRVHTTHLHRTLSGAKEAARRVPVSTTSVPRPRPANPIWRYPRQPNRCQLRPTRTAPAWPRRT